MKVRPHCKKCDGYHWYFVGCEQADELNAREDENARLSEQRGTVVRVFRDTENEFRPVILSNYVQVAPNVFRLRKHAKGKAA